MKQLLTVAFFCAACAIGFAQPGTKTQLDKAINAKNPALADSLLQLRLNYFFSKNLTDSLPQYAFYVGKIASQLSDDATAETKLLSFADRVKKLSPRPIILVNLHEQSFTLSLANTRRRINHLRRLSR